MDIEGAHGGISLAPLGLRETIAVGRWIGLLFRGSGFMCDQKYLYVEGQVVQDFMGDV